jgi:hypothetical protein
MTAPYKGPRTNHRKEYRLGPLVVDGRSMVRGDCLPGGRNAARPCPYLQCSYVLKGGACALDAADQGESTLEEIGDALGVTRERVRQIAEQALVKLGKSPKEARAILACGKLSTGCEEPADNSDDPDEERECEGEAA